MAALLAVPAHADPVPEAPAHVPVWDKGPGGERYVAFGDSFVSGPGINPQRGACGRSEKNFPTLVAHELGANAYVDASCGGATTVHFTEAQEQGAYTNAPQLDALSDDTTLVTFGTMGGNDIGLVQLAIACATADCLPEDGQDPLAEKFAGVEERLTAGLEETRRRAPRAEVLVVGYGTYLPVNGCPTVLPVASDKANYLQGQIDRLSDLMERVAKEQGATFVDQRDIPGAAAHTACARPRQQWIRAFETYDDGILLHPSACGMDATAQHVVRVLDESRGLPVDAFDSSCVSAGPADPETPDTPETPVPTKAERMKALRAKAKAVRVTTSCQQKGRQVRVRAHRGQGAISRVALRVGGKRLAVDTKAPYVLRAKAKKVKRTKGKVRVVVTVRDKGLTHVRKVTVKRPRCVR